MASRSGSACLPLHGGHVPAWLASRMSALGAAVAEAIVLHEGSSGFLRRLSDPFWFQAFGAALGMDWHSSGITTSVMGALKRGLGPRAHELGIHVCGGRGRHSRRTPDELLALAAKTGLDGDALVRASRLVAKVDNTAIDDGYQLYLHAFVVSDEGEWVVVQQGMNEQQRDARRYHWRSQGLRSFVDEPHEGVIGRNQGSILNLTDHRAAGARQAAVEWVDLGPDAMVHELRKLTTTRHAHLPSHHDVRPSDVFLRRLHGVMAVAKQSGAADFESLLLTPGLGPRTVQAMALVAEVVHGAPSRFDDPARFAFAHGGKDGHPHPVPLRVYDETLQTLRRAVDESRVGHTDKLQALRRLEHRVRQLEQCATGASLEQIIDQEWVESPGRGGMTVFGPAGDAVRNRVQGQRDLSPSAPRVRGARAKPDREPNEQLRLFG